MVKFFNNIIFPIAIILFTAQCFPDKIEEQMKESLESATVQINDQYFKTAISLIELHKTRFGKYPESLDSLKHTGLMDQSIFPYVKYTKLDEGYSLDLLGKNKNNQKSLNYPQDFWKGLGLKKSNLKQ